MSDWFAIPNLDLLISAGVLAPTCPAAARRASAVAAIRSRARAEWRRGIRKRRRWKFWRRSMPFSWQYRPLTVRQIFYRLVGKFDFPKDENAYGRLAEYLNRARRAGRHDWRTFAGRSGKSCRSRSMFHAISRDGRV